MNYAALKKYDVANGPGVRVSLFVSGCRHHCKDCFNEVAWSFNYGEPFTNETLNEIIEALKPHYITGFTVLGGEPFEPENTPIVYSIIKNIRQAYPDLSIWCYSGFLYEDLVKRPLVYDVLQISDVLVDGKFEADRKNLMLKFRGSENQRLIDLPRTLKTNIVTLVDETTLY